MKTTNRRHSLNSRYFVPIAMLRRIIATRAVPRAVPVSSLSCRSLSTISSNQKLRNDIKSLGITLGEAIKADDKEVFEAVEKLRQLGREVSSMNIGNQKMQSENVDALRSLLQSNLQRQLTDFFLISFSY